MIHEHVKSFAWGVEPYDKPNTIYIERHEPNLSSTVLRSTDFFQTRENKEILLEEVEDFQLRDKYLFATKSGIDEQFLQGLAQFAADWLQHRTKSERQIRLKHQAEIESWNLSETWRFMEGLPLSGDPLQTSVQLWVSFNRKPMQAAQDDDAGSSDFSFI
ncbi:Sortilin-related receptor, partial [Ophiophagus hannah]